MSTPGPDWDGSVEGGVPAEGDFTTTHETGPNVAYTARPPDAAGAADQAAPDTWSTLQDMPVEEVLDVDTSVFDGGTVERAQELIARYPQSRSALLPMLHLVQSVQGHVSQAGIAFCAQQLAITTAEVSAVATFYTMYKRKPCGEHLVSVCTNTLCAVLGGDEIYDRLRTKLGNGTPLKHEETAGEPGTPGSITLEHAECLAACDLGPVLQVNYEFYDNQTAESAEQLVEALQRGERPAPTRGAPLTDWRTAELQIAGFFGTDEELRSAVNSPSAADETLVGAMLAESSGELGPAMPDSPPPMPAVEQK